jgi:peptidyl-tRNA hydrolase, PTH1 family
LGVEQASLIAGLGNPGIEYAQTRHNAGFMAVERFAARRQAVWGMEPRFQARLARAEFEGRKLFLCEPLTYMNRSGLAVRAVAAYYQVPVNQVLIVVDDADMPLGQVRLRARGSTGGHHGLESVEQHLGTRDYARLRIGIGRRADGQREITDYVLGRFDASDRPWLEAILERVSLQIECWLAAGVKKAMSEWNGVVQAPLPNES